MCYNIHYSSFCYTHSHIATNISLYIFLHIHLYRQLCNRRYNYLYIRQNNHCNSKMTRGCKMVYCFDKSYYFVQMHHSYRFRRMSIGIFQNNYSDMYPYMIHRMHMNTHSHTPSVRILLRQSVAVLPR